MIRFLLLAVCFAVHGVAAMEQSLHGKPRTLGEYCGIPQIERLPVEVKMMIAAQRLKESEWWYNKATLQHGDLVNSSNWIIPRCNFMAKSTAYSITITFSQIIKRLLS